MFWCDNLYLVEVVAILFEMVLITALFADLKFFCFFILKIDGMGKGLL
jgi:hypothetical protein